MQLKILKPAATLQSHSQLLALACNSAKTSWPQDKLSVSPKPDLGWLRAENKPEARTLVGCKTYARETPLQTNGWYDWLGVKLPILDGGSLVLADRRLEAAVGKQLIQPGGND